MLPLAGGKRIRELSSPGLGARGFQKKKLTLADVQEALEKKKTQKRTFLETYYAKWGKKKVGQVEEGKASLETERENVAAQSGQQTKKIKPKEKMSSDKYAAALVHWARKRRKQHHAANAQANEQVLSFAAKTQAQTLHNKEPHYWTPNRLAHYFKCSIEKMRGILYEGKLLAEARKRGIPINEDDLKIDDLFGVIFGSVDYPHTYNDAPDEIPIRKIHNPWYFVDPGVKSANLIRFLRSKETRHYKEASRIPTQQYPKMEVFPEVLGTDAKGRKIKQKPTPPHKIARWIMFDSSVRYHLYDRPILIRDHDNTWRTATWEERRFVENSRRQIKYPFHTPFLPDHDHQPDWVSVQNKPPASFDVAFGNEDYFDDIFQSPGKLSKKSKEYIGDEVPLPPNFEKELDDAMEIGEISKQAFTDPSDLFAGVDDDNFAIDEEDRDNPLTSLNKKNERFAKRFSSYRVKYEYE